MFHNFGKLQENCKFLQLPAQIIFMVYTEQKNSAQKILVDAVDGKVWSY